MIPSFSLAAILLFLFSFILLHSKYYDFSHQIVWNRLIYRKLYRPFAPLYCDNSFLNASMPEGIG